MAVVDADLRRRHQSLGERLGVSTSHVSAGAAIGLGDRQYIESKTNELLADGYRRLKLKIQPDHDRDAIAAVRSVAPDVNLQVDANGSYDSGSVGLLAQLAEQYSLNGIEQPFPPSDPAAASALVATMKAAGLPTALVADESIETITDIDVLANQSALTAVSIKPARVGGLAGAVSMLERCRSLGLDATAGGMLECGLGRHALAAFAGLPGLSIPGDISPASRWIADDPWTDITLSDDGVAVPQSHGVAPEPDAVKLDRLTTDSFEIGE